VVSRNEDARPEITTQPEALDGAQAPDDAAPFSSAGTLAEEPEPATEPGAAVGTAVVTIGERRYEINIDLAAGNRCDPDFFGGLLVVAAEFGGTGNVVNGQFLSREMGGAAALTVEDRFNELAWVADSATMRFGFEYPRGRSQIDSWSQDGSLVTGEATFTDANAVFAWIGAGSVPGEQPDPVSGTFAINCPPIP